MTKKNIDMVKHIKKIVTEKQIDDRQTKQKNRRGSIDVRPLSIEMDDFVMAAAILKRTGGINKGDIK